MCPYSLVKAGVCVTGGVTVAGLTVLAVVVSKATGGSGLAALGACAGTVLVSVVAGYCIYRQCCKAVPPEATQSLLKKSNTNYPESVHAGYGSTHKKEPSAPTHNDKQDTLSEFPKRL